MGVRLFTTVFPRRDIGLGKGVKYTDDEKKIQKICDDAPKFIPGYKVNERIQDKRQKNLKAE